MTTRALRPARIVHVMVLDKFIPRFIEFVAELPKTATGKIQRFRLRDLEQQRA